MFVLVFFVKGRIDDILSVAMLRFKVTVTISGSNRPAPPQFPSPMPLQGLQVD